MTTGCLPQRWPVWLKPDLIGMDGPAVGPFPALRNAAQNGRILLVPTLGHVYGHRGR